MPYFLTENLIKQSEPFTLKGAEADHLIISKRAKVGERVTIQDPQGMRFHSEIISIRKHECSLRPLASVTPPPEPKIAITLYQAFIAEPALDLVISKTTELGASELVIFHASFSPHSIIKQVEKKLDRWNKIAWEAAKQSERHRPAPVRFCKDLTTAIEDSQKHKQKFWLDQSGKNITSASIKPQSTALFVGPEGGWSDTERSILAKINHNTSLSLGPRILKAETASIASLSILSFQLGNM